MAKPRERSGWYPGRCKDCAQPGAPCGECSACRRGRECETPRGRCADCGKAHKAREAERRAERRAKHLCWVCGEKAVKVDGETLSTCADHREYFRARDEAQRSQSS